MNVYIFALYIFSRCIYFRVVRVSLNIRENMYTSKITELIAQKTQLYLKREF